LRYDSFDELPAARRLRRALLVCLGALCACSAPLEPRRTPVTPRWSATPAPAATEPSVPALPLDPPAPGGALTLEQLVNRALVANRGLIDARDALLSAEYSLQAAESAFELKIFPRSSASVLGTQETTSDIYGLGMEVSKRFETGTDVSVTPSVELFDGQYTSRIATRLRQPLLRGSSKEAVRSGVNAAEFSARSTARNLYRAQVDTVLATISAAYQVVRQREFLRLNEESAARLAGHANAARARERVGLASSLDVFRANLQAGQARDELDSARERYGEALDTLRIQLALALDAELEVDAPLAFDDVVFDERSATQLALAERVELAQARDSMAEAERRSRVARHNTQPDLDLALSYSQFGTSGAFGTSTELDQNAVTLSLVTTSDIARTAEFAQYEQSRLAVGGAARNIEFQRDQVVRQVRSALRDLDRSKKRINLQREQIAQAEGQLALARVKFNHGLASNFDVIEAESQLRAGQTELVSAVIDHILGTYRLRARLGTLLERPEGV